jgi:aminoglycoside phosphotransferase (APT) family kinase protein
VTHKLHEDEVDVDEALVARLVAAQFPEWAGLPIEPVDSSGTVHAIYRLGEDLAVRLPRIEGALADAETERRWLPVLAPRLPVAIPARVADGRPGEGYPWPWSVYRWRTGRIPEPGGAGVGVARDLAAFLLALRSVDRTGAPQGSGRGVPLPTRDEETRAALGELRGVIDVDRATAAWKAALAAPAWDLDGVWLHGDLLPANLLVEGDSLAAVLDFGCLTLGDPACDAMAGWTIFAGDARRAFRKTLGVDDATWARSRGWALSWAAIALPYYLETNPVICAAARHAIEAVLVET